MGFGSFGGGGSSPSPSSSNLSASAPPFTVDRSNSKPGTASLLQFPESSYATSFGHTWQFANPPVSGPVVYKKSELETDSTIITPATSANDYHFRYCPSPADNKQSNHWSTLSPCSETAIDAFLFDPKVETYYPRYVSPVVDDGTPLVALNDPSYDVLPPSDLVSSNASAPVDYTQSLSDLEYNRNWGGGGACYGVVDAKRGKHAKLDGSFVSEKSNATDAVAYTSYLNQGCNMVLGENMPEEGSSCSYGQFSDVMGRESCKHPVGMEHADYTSFLAQQVLSLPFDSSRTAISSSSFTTSESISPCPSLQSSKNFPNYQNPYLKGNRLINSCSSTAVSVMNSSPTLVIRPPPAGTSLALQESSFNHAVYVDVTSVHENAVGNKSPARAKEPQVLQNREGANGVFNTSNMKTHIDETDKVFSVSPVVEGIPGKGQSKDSLSHVSRMNSGSPFMNVSASDGSSISGDGILAVKSSENLDCLDHHNLAVDSPCWKGAPSSHFVPFDAVEASSSLDLIKKLDECRLQVPPIRPPSVKVAKDRTHQEYGSASPEQINADISKSIPLLTSSKGVQFYDEYSKAGKDYIQLKQAKNDSLLKFSDHKQLGGEGYSFDTKKSNLQDTVMDTIMSVNDPTEGAVAVRAAEDVLCSPSSEESFTEQVKPHKSQAAPVMDVQTLINTMKNLSDLLVFSCSSNQCALKEQGHEALKHVICNLDSLLSQRTVHMSQAKELALGLDDSENVVDYFHPHECVSAGKPQLENKAPLQSHGQPDYQQYCHKKKSASFQQIPSLMTDLDVLSDDSISQAIKKVLDEDSYFGEEDHSQALLFKSLWLEAEAKLYSISYRARFDRMKIEMERLKAKPEKDVTGKITAPKESSKPETLPACNASILLPPEAEKVSTPKVSLGASFSNADNVQASVLNVLSCGDDPKPFNIIPGAESEDVEASVMNRFHILKHRDDPIPKSPGAGQQAVCSDDSVTVSPGNSGKRTLYSVGSTENSSSDWEHVLKEDISWR